MFLEVEGLNKMLLLIPGAQNHLGFLAEQPEAGIGFQEHIALSFLDLKQQDQTDLRHGTEFAGFLWDSPCPSGLQGGEAPQLSSFFLEPPWECPSLHSLNTALGPWTSALNFCKWQE